MQMTYREIWTALHGMALGAGFLLLFSAGLAAIWALRSNWITAEGTSKLLSRLAMTSWGMAILSWLTVILGTYMIYPWYRAKAPPHASADVLAGFPKYLLMSNEQTKDWHEFGMEWKEHIAWFTPILATAVAVVVTRYGRQIAQDAKLRRALLILFSIAFFCASVAGVFGALINKAAPTR